MAKTIRVRMLRTAEKLEAGQSYILNSDVARTLIADGAAFELFEVKPTGPTEFKPVAPSEIKEEFSGKKKVKPQRY